MILFSFEKCVSQLEAKKVKKIYLISSIVLFIILGLIVGLVSKNMVNSFYEELGKIGYQNAEPIKIEQLMEKSEEVSKKVRPISFLTQLAILYLTIWACFKLGMGNFASIFLGVLTLVPFVSIIPFIVILTRKFPSTQTGSIIQK